MRFANEVLACACRTGRHLLSWAEKRLAFDNTVILLIPFVLLTGTLVAMGSNPALDGAYWQRNGHLVLLLCLTITVLSVLIVVTISHKNQLLRELAHANQELERRVVERTATLHESEALAHHISDVAPAVLYIYDLRENRNVWVNREMRTALGYSQNEIKGFGGKILQTLMHPDDLARYGEHAKRIMELADGETAEFDYRCRHANGSWVWLHSRCMVFKRDAEGQPIQLIGAALDIRKRKEAEEKVQEREERYSMALKATNDGVWDLDVATGALEWNDVYQKLFNRPAGTNSIQWWSDRIHPDDRERTLQSFRDAVAGSVESWSGEYRFLRTNGEWAFIFDRAYIARDAAGNAYRIVGAMQDLTERKLMEQALIKAQKRLESLVRVSAQIVWTTNAQGLVEEDAPMWREMTGQTFEEIIGWGWLDALHPDDRERVHATWLQHVTTTTMPLEIEYRLRNHHRSGDWRWMLVRAVALQNPDGSIAEWVGMSTDITERKHADELVRASEEHLQMALEAARTAAYAYDPTTGAIKLSANALDVLGTPPTHETEAYALMHPDDIEPHRAILTRAIAECSAYRNRYRRRIKPDGKYHWFDERGRAEVDARGHPIRLIGVITDVTPQVRAEEALQAVDRRKDEFLATLAHELRNPLAPVRTAAQILKLKAPPIREVQWAIDVIGRQTQVMARLIDDLMDVSRISRGKIELKRERIDLGTVVQGAVETSRPLIEEMNHQLTVNLPSVPVMLYCDATRLAQVILNLLNNAAKYTERGGRIFLSAERKCDEVVISVKDTGIGIPPDKLPTIFEMFSQVETALSRSRGGLGIGLSLVHKLVQMHGGRVSAHSEGPGKGSEFVVRLPIATDQEHASVDGPGATVNQESTTLRILVIDDNEDAAASLAMMLTMMGHQAYQAYDGEAGIKAAREYRPDVVLCDIGLPKRNGYEVCREIREEPWGRNTFLVAVTGWGQDSDRKASKDAGFDHHLVKPVDSKALLKLLGDATSQNARAREEQQSDGHRVEIRGQNCRDS